MFVSAGRKAVDSLVADRLTVGEPVALGSVRMALVTGNGVDLGSLEELPGFVQEGGTVGLCVASAPCGAAADTVLAKHDESYMPREVADALAEIAFKFTHFVMFLAPAAVFAAMASTLAAGGAATFAGLARFLVASWVLQLLFLLGVLGGGLLAFRVPLRRFVRHLREPFLIAFATTSSAAALPIISGCSVGWAWGSPGDGSVAAGDGAGSDAGLGGGSGSSAGGSLENTWANWFTWRRRLNSSSSSSLLARASAFTVPSCSRGSWGRGISTRISASMGER